jgi:hypothetical protein
MIGVLVGIVVRGMLRPFARWGAALLAALVLACAGELAAERFLDGDLPRWVDLALLLVLAAAWRFLRARWRRSRSATSPAGDS